MGRESLKSAFSRVFTLAMVKFGSMLDFGSWVHGAWNWDISLRRHPLDLVVHLLEEFQSTIKGVFLDEGTDDSVVWK